jgi:phenylacetaldehyde dehydrogenase
MNDAVKPFDGHAIAPETAAFLYRPHRLLIDGAWVDGHGGTWVTTDPATGLPLATVQMGHAADIDLAVAAARRAFEGPWRRMTVSERTALLFRLARIMEGNSQLLAELNVLDNGMPMFIAGLTVANCVEMVDYYAGAIMRIEGTTIAPPRHVAAEAEALTYTLREPVGVAGQIVPWNVPLSTAILKLAPALAAGCTVVIKPSEETPLSILALGAMIVEAGLPAGVVNIVNGLGATAGARLAEHPDVDKISFTGSTATGKRIVQAALGNLKKVSLELGGKSPVVVMPDADLSLAIPGVALATFFLQGQNCMAGTRIFVHDAIHDQLVEGLAAFAVSMALGHGLSLATQQGPMISDAHTAKVMSYIKGAVAAPLLPHGVRVDRPVARRGRDRQHHLGGRRRAHRLYGHGRRDGAHHLFRHARLFLRHRQGAPAGSDPAGNPRRRGADSASTAQPAVPCCWSAPRFSSSSPSPAPQRRRCCSCSTFWAWAIPAR